MRHLNPKIDFIQTSLSFLKKLPRSSDVRSYKAREQSEEEPGWERRRCSWGDEKGLPLMNLNLMAWSIEKIILNNEDFYCHPSNPPAEAIQICQEATGGGGVTFLQAASGDPSTCSRIRSGSKEQAPIHHRYCLMRIISGVRIRCFLQVHSLLHRLHKEVPSAEHSEILYTYRYALSHAGCHIYYSAQSEDLCGSQGRMDPGSHASPRLTVPHSSPPPQPEGERKDAQETISMWRKGEHYFPLTTAYHYPTFIFV
ncbi:uncharacterized protein LOC128328087 isoform X2 [Hemicordylus capensis]|uniref:uncharacterized protein LOC128328087 isoform X2 n=1 Tax=Hemicordylus capensis TaxID=884348 RepID=UPI0023023D01|nr:uncharacterized protein LOC128328087 isoform X2 [Hemicordylus capensis]